MSYPIRYIRSPLTGNFHVNLIVSPRQQLVILPRYFSRVTGVSLDATLGATEINSLQAAALGFNVSIPITEGAAAV